MKKYRIVVIPGDGIGPEIVNATVEILEKLQSLSGNFKLDFEFHEAGAAFYLKSGEAISPGTLKAIKEANATLKGPSGLPNVRLPDGTEAGLLGGTLRLGFDLYANLRPIRLFPNVPTPLRNREADSIDYLFLRENSEGLYLSRGKGVVTEQAAMDTLFLTRKGCERISRFAFKLAKEKERGAPEDGKKRVTLFDKANVLRSFSFFRRIFLEIAQETPEVEAEFIHADAAAAALITHPEHFQVVVTENMFGDILSDLAGATIGGLGMCPSGNIGEDLAYFEPIHGSAPRSVGKNRANPISQIRSAALMLDYLGEKKEAMFLEKATWSALENGRFIVSSAGKIEGGGKVVVEAVCEELNRIYLK